MEDKAEKVPAAAVTPPPGLTSSPARAPAAKPPAPAKSAWAGWGRPAASAKPAGSLSEIQVSHLSLTVFATALF
jgi:hypothetical protein